MKSVHVYVEGPSDVAAITELLRPLFEAKNRQGIAIRFFEAPRGDKKASVIRKVPLKAVSILRNEPEAMVIAMPDLYPLNKEVPHTTPDELFAAIHTEFDKALADNKLNGDKRYKARFKVFCFKYELEALVLAAETILAERLKLKSLTATWQKPVEDQNNHYPPKQVLQDLFAKHGHHYIDTSDAPLILGLADYHQIADACPQQFKPFVEFLESLTP